MSVATPKRPPQLRIKSLRDFDQLADQRVQTIGELLELARPPRRGAAIHSPRREVCDAQPNGNHDDNGGPHEVERPDADANDRPHAATPHAAPDTAEDGPDELAHVLLNRDPRLAAANRDRDFEIAPQRLSARRDP